MEAARASGLAWPDYPDAQAADMAASDRENTWQRLGRMGAQEVPPLWRR